MVDAATAVTASSTFDDGAYAATRAGDTQKEGAGDIQASKWDSLGPGTRTMVGNGPPYGPECPQTDARVSEGRR